MKKDNIKRDNMKRDNVTRDNVKRDNVFMSDTARDSCHEHIVTLLESNVDTAV